ncbi:MAG TPA: methyltransferase domain-containing protein [Vicinamibacteria bacterium]|jgi:hypothetical protein
MDLKEAHELRGMDPEEHWYYASKSLPLFRECERAIAANQGRPIAIADVGAGEGVFARALIRRFPEGISRATLIDSGYETEEACLDSLIGGVPVTRVRSLPSRLEAGLVLLMDVLEHIEDDAEFLRRVVVSAAPGTRFFITVPAFRLLWSKHDLYLGHFRRYRLKELASLCLGAGLELQEKFYFFATIFPAVFALRALRAVSGGEGTRSDLRPAHPAVNALLKKLLLLESLWCRANRLLGVSAVVCAQSRMSRLSSGPAQ